MVWYRTDKKRTTDDLLQMSIGWMKKHGCFEENCIINGGLTWTRHSGLSSPRKIGSIAYSSNFIGKEKYITLNYTFREKEDLNYKIPITYNIPYYGGRRYWFICPKCGRKVAFLYGGKYFLCRHCQNLSYPTQQMDFSSRMLERGKKYENKVLVDGCRKRWTHHSTFERYMDKSEYYERLG